jgi:hypothetical protein
MAQEISAFEIGSQFILLVWQVGGKRFVLLLVFFFFFNKKKLKLRFTISYAACEFFTNSA